MNNQAINISVVTVILLLFLSIYVSHETTSITKSLDNTVLIPSTTTIYTEPRSIETMDPIPVSIPIPTENIVKMPILSDSTQYGISQYDCNC